MYELEFIAIAEFRRGPIGASDNLMVEFDGDTLSGKRKESEKAVDVDRRRDLAGFTIEKDFDFGHYPDFERWRTEIQIRNLKSENGAGSKVGFADLRSEI